MNVSYALTGCSSPMYSSMLWGNKVICSRLPHLYAMIVSFFFHAKFYHINGFLSFPPSAIIVTQSLDRGIQNLLKRLDSRFRENDEFSSEPKFLDRLYRDRGTNGYQYFYHYSVN